MNPPISLYHPPRPPATPPAEGIFPLRFFEIPQIKCF